MSTKQKRLKLSWPHPNMDRNYNTAEDPHGKNAQVYRVEDVDNSTDFVPGQQLTKAQVTDLTQFGPFEIKMVRRKEDT